MPVSTVASHAQQALDLKETANQTEAAKRVARVSPRSKYRLLTAHSLCQVSLRRSIMSRRALALTLALPRFIFRAFFHFNLFFLAFSCSRSSAVKYLSYPNQYICLTLHVWLRKKRAYRKYTRNPVSESCQHPLSGSGQNDPNSRTK